VLAVEQHVGRVPRRSGVCASRAATRRARQFAESLHDRVLAAADPFHVLPIIVQSISVTISPVKERILKKFEDEIAQLDKELKTELPKEIKRARELGDLRENAEYQAAKERQRLVESRISLLQKRVSEIQLMNLDKIPKDKVGFGSTVTLQENTGQTIVYQLVMPEDANVDDGLISTASPIGRALLNKEEGDEVVVKTPNGAERHFEITKLVTIHD
jgi:transcription elongation factor GreA